MEHRVQNLDAAKFSTQREVTYVLLVIFAGVVVTVLWQNDQSERSMIIQTVINLGTAATFYWIGASKAAADSSQAMTRIAEASPMSPTVQTGTISTDTVKVDAQTAIVNGEKP